MKRGFVLFFLLSNLLYVNELDAQVLMPTNDLRKNTLSLNGLWKFKYLPSLYTNNDSSFHIPSFNINTWLNIKVPGCWEMQGFADPNYATNLKPGIGLYRTTFQIPKNWNDKQVYIGFDGVAFGYDFWVNGLYAGSFASSYNRQTFNITQFVQKNKINTLAVKVSTRPKGWEFDSNDDWSLSGIIRDVNLFTLPQIHIKDVVVTTKVKNDQSAVVLFKTVVDNEVNSPKPESVDLQVILTDQNGRIINKTVGIRKYSQTNGTIEFLDSLAVSNPKLWTAETPSLYNLEVVLSANKVEIQKQKIKVGIREVSIDNKVIKLNGKPIKLRGVNRHDISHVNGRAVSEAEIKQDLTLIKRANINFIRTSHYPSHHRLIDLCDSLGIYVIDEIPFGHGDENLNDSTYLPILLQRAQSTIWRDKNHPSVLFWSVGNENRITDIGLKTGKYVKKLDPTRPYCFPTVGSYFQTVKNNYPDSVDILSPHYPSVKNLIEFDTKFDRPFLITEYAHDFGLDFDRLETLWETIYKSEHIAGGAIWHFADQGIIRKSKEKVDNTQFNPYVWTDPYTYFDCFLDKGTDGIVYSDRIPQVDYWQVRKVYSPFIAHGDSIGIKPGMQTVTLKIENRFDFTNLLEIPVEWELFADTVLIKKGKMQVNCAPHSITNVPLAIELPSTLNAYFYRLKLKCFDKERYRFYEKTYVLYHNNQPKLNNILIANNNKFDGVSFNIESSTGMLMLKTKQQKIISNGPYLRVGRKMSLSQWIDKDETSTDSVNITTKKGWFPHYLTKPFVLATKNDQKEFTYTYKYERAGAKNQYFDGTVHYTVTDNGGVMINYRFTPHNTTGIFLETGLSFVIPGSFSEFKWVGNGPFPSYPGKSKLNEFGFYHLNSGDLNYQGNYSKVQIAVLSDSKGNGFAVLCNNANIALEKISEGILFSHNSNVSGRYSKKSLPDIKINAEDEKEISGSFTIIPLIGNWSRTLQQLFGLPTKTVPPFKPYYHSYDQ